MVKRKSFESEIMQGMENNLFSIASEEDQKDIPKAIDFLDKAIQLFEDSGKFAQADALINFLEKFANKNLSKNLGLKDTFRIRDVLLAIVGKNPTEDLNPSEQYTASTLLNQATSGNLMALCKCYVAFIKAKQAQYFRSTFPGAAAELVDSKIFDFDSPKGLTPELFEKALRHDDFARAVLNNAFRNAGVSEDKVKFYLDDLYFNKILTQAALSSFDENEEEVAPETDKTVVAPPEMLPPSWKPGTELSKTNVPSISHSFFEKVPSQNQKALEFADTVYRKAQSDKHTSGLTSEKMVKNLLDHGTEFNLSDDNYVQDLLDTNFASDLDPDDVDISEEFEDE